MLLKIVTAILLLPALLFAFAWVPMLAWNYGIHVIFPQTPVIGYFTAFWLFVAITCLKTPKVGLDITKE